MKIAFQKVAEKKGVKMSVLLIDFVKKEIEEAGIQIGSFVDKNQRSIFDENEE